MTQTQDLRININFDNKKTILENIQAFIEMEYDSEFEDCEALLQHTINGMMFIPLAHTTLEDDEDIQIQTNLDVQNRKLIKRVTGSNSLVHEEAKFYKDDDTMINAIEQYTFEELIYLEADTDWLIKVLK